jgi:copper(I)-binding protein
MMRKARHASSSMHRPGRGAVSAAVLALGLLAAPALATAMAATAPAVATAMAATAAPAVATAATAPALATAATAPAVTISHPWMRFLTPRIPAAGYFALSNASAQPVTLTAAASPDCGQLMLHRSISENGTARMEMVASVVVPAHGTVTFSPGGYHLMCMAPTAAIAPGQSMPVSLRFSDGTSLSANFPVYGAKGQ